MSLISVMMTRSEAHAANQVRDPNTVLRWHLSAVSSRMDFSHWDELIVGSSPRLCALAGPTRRFVLPNLIQREIDLLSLVAIWWTEEPETIPPVARDERLPIVSPSHPAPRGRAKIFTLAKAVHSSLRVLYI